MVKGIVTSEYLVKGYALALEQCGLLLRDAVLLYEARSYANAVVMAAFAREELGRSKILLDLWRGQLNGSPVTVEQINAACMEHVDKQRAGMLSTTMRADRESVLGKLLTARMTNAPQSEEQQTVDASLRQIDEIKVRRTPGDRHSARMRALYVEPTSGGEWNRPSDISAQTAHDFLQDAINDYSLRRNQGYISSDQSILKDVEPDLYNALTLLADRPQLPPPVHPSWPTLQGLSEERSYFERKVVLILTGAIIGALVIFAAMACH